MRKAATDIVTPFDWQRYTASNVSGTSADPRRKPAARNAKRLTVKERVARIMAQRWGNPYCKPGAA